MRIKLPALQHSERDSEDVDDSGEIHAFDGVTYGLQYKKIVSRLVRAAGFNLRSSSSGGFGTRAERGLAILQCFKAGCLFPHIGKPTEKPTIKENQNTMKTIRMRMQKFSRPGVILMATVVVIITSMVVANATQTITTPNAAFISYNLTAGASSTPITPVTNKSVLVMGCSTSSGNIGVGQVSLLNSPLGFIEWVGLESTGTGITAGSSGGGGTHIVYIDSFHAVDIKTASAETILIHNGDISTRAGNVTLIW